MTDNRFTHSTAPPGGGRAVGARPVNAVMQNSCLLQPVTAPMWTHTVNEQPVTAQPTAPQWRPISEAPKDETRVLLLVSGRDPVVIGKWSPFRSQWFFESSRHPLSATQWMPLPTPPGKEAP